MRIKVAYKPREHELLDGEWRCIHADTEIVDVITNEWLSGSGTYHQFEDKREVCVPCKSIFSPTDEEWVETH